MQKLVRVFYLVGVIAAITFFSLKTLHSPSSAQTKEIKGIAVLGDSHSDEYTADDNRGDPNTIVNWVEILHKYRQLNFGPWDKRAEPRRSGFEYNWARSGATAQSFLDQNQHVGVAELVKAGKVDTVVLFIGSNDFAHYDPGNYKSIYNGSLAGEELDRKIEKIGQNIATAVSEIKKEGSVEILVVEIWDWGKQVQVQKDFPDPEKRKLVSDAINKTNLRIRQLSQDLGFFTADSNTYYDQVFSDQSEVKLADLTINRAVYGPEPSHEFLGDYIHAGTILNGLFANFIIENLNKNLGTDIKRFEDQEILDLAGFKK